MKFYRTRGGEVVSEMDVEKAINIYGQPLPDGSITEIKVSYDTAVKLANEGYTVAAINMFRSLLNVSLVEAKKLADAIRKS